MISGRATTALGSNGAPARGARHGVAVGELVAQVVLEAVAVQHVAARQLRVRQRGQVLEANHARLLRGLHVVEHRRRRRGPRWEPGHEPRRQFLRLGLGAELRVAFEARAAGVAVAAAEARVHDGLEHRDAQDRDDGPLHHRDVEAGHLVALVLVENAAPVARLAALDRAALGNVQRAPRRHFEEAHVRRAAIGRRAGGGEVDVGARGHEALGQHAFTRPVGVHHELALPLRNTRKVKRAEATALGREV
eukprot:CAMPEP_0174853026 /NCGR_PEP_ID=MMETSP1114-20130205/27321_1 /TAXON_ID=312471 /ORGANISM="Neobodo designis, Strain CCAP 1951/1" /LENGTH=248 /DNA_ID=CAMNT_0016087647 /DNA_START=66 /DNA_END=813 /DNA_ORIENTATION=+